MRYINFESEHIVGTTYMIPDSFNYVRRRDFKKYWREYCEDIDIKENFEDWLMTEKRIFIEAIDIEKIID